MKYWEKLIELINGEEKKQPIPGMDDKTSLILLMMKMAQIDGKVNHFEIMNIQLLSRTLGVDAIKVNQFKESLDDVVLVLPETPIERMDYFWRLLTLMKIDLYAHPKELEMCEELGMALRFKKKQVEKAVNYMQENLLRVVKFDEFKAKMLAFA